jgi:hypothetical protein
LAIAEPQLLGLPEQWLADCINGENSPLYGRIHNKTITNLAPGLISTSNQGPRMATQKYCLIIFTCVVVFLLVPFRSLSGRRETTIGLPGMPDVVVGVSLTASYGVVSLRKDDGTFEDVGCIESVKDYAEMIERLSAPEAQRAR